MKKDTALHDFILYDVFSFVPDVYSKPMMSGWCFYSNEKPFAAIIGNELYFKATGGAAQKLAKLGCKQFSYTKRNQQEVTMNYWSAPSEIFDDHELCERVVDIVASGK